MIEKDQPPLEGDQQSALRNAQLQALDEADPSLLVRPEVRSGAFPGNEHIRFVYPRQPALRRVRRGVLEATAAAQAPQGVWGRILNFGTIFISGAGTSVAPIPDIADPLVFRRKFMEATNRPIVMPRP